MSCHVSSDIPALRAESGARLRNRVIFTLSAMMLFSGEASAALFGCAGPIKTLRLHDGGTIQLDFGHGLTSVCRLNSDIGNLTQQTCQALYSSALTAYTTRLSIKLYFNSNDATMSGVSQCGQLGGEALRVPFLFELTTP